VFLPLFLSFNIPFIHNGELRGRSRRAQRDANNYSTNIRILLKIKEFVNDFDQITKLAERHKLTITKRDVQHIVENDSLEFVTVAEAVINYVTKNKYDFVLPLGTSGITNIYMNEISRTKSKIKLIEVSEKLQDFVFKTITASISNSEVEIKKQTQNIKNEIGIIKQQYKGSIAIN